MRLKFDLNIKDQEALTSLAVKLFVSIGCAFLPLHASAQTSEFELWKQQQQQAFQQFRTAEDEAFLEFLKKEWKAFEIFTGERRDTTPKPATPPVIRNSSSGPSGAHEKADQKKIRTLGDTPALTGFYGHPVKAFSFPVKPSNLPDTIDQANRAALQAWEILSLKDHSSLLAAVRAERSRLELGDWGLVLLLEHALSQQGYSTNARRFYTWFVLNRLNYRIKLGAAEGQIFYLLPSQQLIYDNRFSIIDGVRYYTIPEISDGEVFSYGDSPLTNERLFDVQLNRLIASGDVSVEQTLSLQVDGHLFSLRWRYDPGIVEFMEDYPQVDLPLYFQTSVAGAATESFLAAVRPRLEGLSTREAADQLLRLTQEMFSYETDDDQFGYEKYLLAPQSLHYATNDCEDRSVFLAWLLRKLLDLDVIALDYPGHVALAVKIPLQPGDEFVEYQDRKYVIADPTYIGAHLGQAMPEMSDLIAIGIPVTY